MTLNIQFLETESAKKLNGKERTPTGFVTGGKSDSQATLILWPNRRNAQYLLHERVGPQSNCILLAREKNAAGIPRIIKTGLHFSFGPFLERSFPGRTRVESQLGPDRGCSTRRRGDNFISSFNWSGPKGGYSPA